MSVVNREDEQNGFASVSHNDSDSDRSSVGSRGFTSQGLRTLVIGDERYTGSERADEYLSPLSPVVPTMRDPAAQRFDDFIRQARLNDSLSTKQLESLFKRCGYAVQRLGSALGLSKSSLEFYRALRRVRIHFQENSEALTGLPHARERPISVDQLARYRGSMPSVSNGSTIVFEDDINLLEYLEKLHSVLGEFVVAIVEFNDYYADDEGGDALHSFRREIRLLHESLSYFGNENTKELKRYVLSRAISMREYVDDMSVAMKRFIDNGIPCIAYAQKRSAKVLANASTVATFFSGVAATTLQYSFNTTRTPVDNATNTLWFAALVLSIGSAVSSLLTMTWRQAIYSRPPRSLPSSLRLWMRHGYLVLLAAAVLTYCSGLITYVFAQQSKATAWIILALIILCDLAITILATWYTWEKWNFFALRRRNVSMQWATNWVKRALADVHRRGASAIRKDGSSVPLSNLQLGGQSGSLGDSITNTQAQARLRLPRHRNRSTSHSLLRTPLPSTLDASQSSKKERMTMIKNLTNPVDMEEKGVRHMQFSPCGRWFVACFRKTSRIYFVENTVQRHQKMIHRGGNAKQVEWAQHGERFLTRFKHGVNLWELKDGSFSLTKTFNLPDLCLIRWLNDSEFLALTDFGDTLFKINVEKDGKRCYNLPRDLQIRDMSAVCGQEHDRVILVASRPLGLPGDAPKGIDCLIVFSLDDAFIDEKPFPLHSRKSGANRRIEKRIPLTDHIMNTTVCRDRRHMLISYETKPPELWVLGEELRTISLKQNLSLPPSEAKDGVSRKHVLWGEPFFLGEAQDIMACAANGAIFLFNTPEAKLAYGFTGDMHFWRLDDFSMPFHRLAFAKMSEQIDGQPIYCFNNSLAKNAVMATAAMGGSLKIWSSGAATGPSDHISRLTPSTPSSLNPVAGRFGQ
ncbi:hypothetical protein SCHPADRAFT_994468 [Schizopora paradoxa]|uniref:WD40 repeat-like protein n=1 Tax=Schizopora paradoxa TaxID=27342 RepID=A0A0H2RYW7_9AGAM|nr:hypothetical protein SCHPADRAFT_994468 [Schizopora paradoxa]